MDFFGFEITKKGKRKEQEKEAKSFVPQTFDDGALELDNLGSLSYQVQSPFNFEKELKSEISLINEYRRAAMHPDAENAIDEICSEAIVTEEEEPCVAINVDKIELGDGIKKKIVDEFEEIKTLLDLDNKAYDIFKSWYVDGRLYYHKILDTNKPSNGLTEVRRIDPRNIKKVREMEKVKDKNGTNTELVRTTKEYFVYNPAGVSNMIANVGMKISPDAITFVHSGIFDPSRTKILSHIHKSIKPLNQLSMVEDASVIYRITRAPERRVFKVDVGNRTRGKAEQFVKKIMNKYKNKIVYDSVTGKMATDKRHMTMLEDFFLPQKDGRGTEIDTLPGGENLGQIEDINYFLKRFYKSLNVPTGRLEPENSLVNLGRASEITRDELKFQKFIVRLQKQFTQLFDDILRTQLILKQIINSEEWDDIKEKIFYEFAKDSFYTESKELDLLQGRLEVISSMIDYVPEEEHIFFDREYIYKKVLRMNDEDVKELMKRIGNKKPETDDDINNTDSNKGFGDN